MLEKFKEIIRNNELVVDSRLVKDSSVFFAIKGTKIDSHNYIEKLNNKCKLIIADINQSEKFKHIENVFFVDNTRKALAEAIRIKAIPMPNSIFIVTGTNGKTSVSNFIMQILNDNALNCAVVGTIGTIFKGKLIEEGLTTPSSLELSSTLKTLYEIGANSVALEASSHGLEQYRLHFINPSVAGFTNITQDHMDYHKTFEHYYESKLKLFTEVLEKGKTAVVNSDTPLSLKLIEDIKNSGRHVISYGKNGDLKILKISKVDYSQLVEFQFLGRKYEFMLPLLGDFMVYNALCAMLMVYESAFIDLDSIIKSAESLKNVPGRMELVGKYNGASIFVDYAHTPDALENILKTAKTITNSKIHIVFGCGGDRDKLKRPIMGKIANDLADYVVITDDNPRTEDASIIRAEIKSSCIKAMVIGDRREAIESAIKSLNSGDILLIAGKGHENGQIIGNITYDFNDKEVVLEIIK